MNDEIDLVLSCRCNFKAKCYTDVQSGLMGQEDMQKHEKQK